jgi:hypothetical protein
MSIRLIKQRSRRNEMNQTKNLSGSIGWATRIATIALALILCGAFAGKVFAAQTDSLDQLYEKAKKEGKITLYAPLSPQTMTVLPAAFMKRFPGVTVDHIDATSDKLIARVLAEQKGGRVIADVIRSADVLAADPRPENRRARRRARGGGVSGPVERRPLDRDGYAILYRRMEHHSGEERRRAESLRGPRESQMER